MLRPQNVYHQSSGRNRTARKPAAAGRRSAARRMSPSTGELLWNELVEVETNVGAAAEIEHVRAAHQVDPNVAVVRDCVCDDAAPSRLTISPAWQSASTTVRILNTSLAGKNLALIAPTVSPPSVNRRPNGGVLVAAWPTTI